MPVDTPEIISEPFGVNAGSQYITNPIPETTSTPGAASFDQGFPPLTMTAIAAGGIPPFGQDMNGILYMITSNIAALWAGQPYLWNSTVAADISGYQVGTILGMSDGSGLWLNTVAGNETNPDDNGTAAGWVPLFRYGAAVLTGLTSGTVTLTPAQSRCRVVVLEGTLNGNLNVVFPATQQEWLIVNATTGAFTVTCSSSGANNVAVVQGSYAEPTGIYGDGAGNIYAAYAPVQATPSAVAPTPSTLVLRSNAGYVYATYLNQNSSSSENPAIGAVFVESTAADGFLRKASLSYFIGQLLSGSLGTTGYLSIPFGDGGSIYNLIVQWGFFAGETRATGPQNYLVTLPTSFPHASLMGLVTYSGPTASNSSAYCSWAQNSNSSFYAGFRDVSNEGFTNNCFWLTIGF